MKILKYILKIIKWSIFAFIAFVLTIFIYFEFNEIPIYNPKVAYKFILGKTNYTQSLKPERKIKLNLDEGTWMSLDVSPDGNTLAFDLLGDIYTLPIEGGKAKR